MIALYTHFDIRDYPRAKIRVERTTEPDETRTFKTVLRDDGTVLDGRGDVFATTDLWFADTMTNHRMTHVADDVWLYSPPKAKVEKRD